MRRSLVVVCVVAAVVVGAGTAVSAPGSGRSDPGCAPKWWPQPRQSSCANGLATDPRAPSPANVARLAPAWTYRAGSALGQPIVWAGPGLSVPTVFVVAGDGTLRAVTLATGAFRWKAKVGEEAFPPVAAGDVLLAISGWGVLRRYVPRSGHIVWQRTILLDMGPGRQVVADGNWYMSADGSLFAYDVRTGRERWTQHVECHQCEVAAAGGRVYVAGAMDGSGSRLYLLDARTGKTIWSASATAGNLSTGASPVIANGMVFVRTMSDGDGDTFDFAIEAYRAADGRHLWRGEVGTAKGFWFTPPATDGSLVVQPLEDGSLVALDAATGALRWKAPGMSIHVRPAIGNGLVWAADDGGSLVALAVTDGSRLWTSPPFGKEGPGHPVLAGGFVLFGLADGRLLAYRVPAK